MKKQEKKHLRNLLKASLSLKLISEEAWRITTAGGIGYANGEIAIIEEQLNLLKGTLKYNASKL